MLLYNAAVVTILFLAWTSQGLSGVALWPVVLAHGVLAVWFIMALSIDGKERRRDHPVPEGAAACGASQHKAPPNRRGPLMGRSI